MQINNMSPELYLEKALQYQEKEEWDLAIKNYNKYIEYNKNNEKVYCNIGICYYEKGDLPVFIIDYFKMAIKLNPNFPTPYLFMYYMYEDQRIYQPAIDNLTTFINLIIKSNCEEYKMDVLYYNLGNLHSEINNHDTAIMCYNKAIELNPKMSSALNNMGNVYFDLEFFYYKKGSYNKAIDCYCKALEIGPNDYYTIVNLANTYRAKLLYDKAIFYYRKSIALNPSLTKAYIKLAKLYECCLKNYDLAIYNYKKSLEFEQEEWSIADTFYRISVCYERKGEIETSIVFLIKSVEKDKCEVKYRKIAEYYDKQGNSDMAKKYYNYAEEYKD